MTGPEKAGEGHQGRCAHSQSAGLQISHTLLARYDARSDEARSEACDGALMATRLKEYCHWPTNWQFLQSYE